MSIHIIHIANNKILTSFLVYVQFYPIQEWEDKAAQAKENYNRALKAYEAANGRR